MQSLLYDQNGVIKYMRFRETISVSRNHLFARAHPTREPTYFTTPASDQEDWRAKTAKKPASTSLLSQTRR